MKNQVPYVPFYLMNHKNEFHPGRPLENMKEEIAGFEEAIRNTKKRIADYKVDGADTSELEVHLKGLEKYLEKIKGKV